MDKNKQFTSTAHPIGATIHPEPPPGKASKIDLSKVDLSSDFSSDIDPNAHEDKKSEAPADIEVITKKDAPVKAAPKEESDEATEVSNALAAGLNAGSVMTTEAEARKRRGPAWLNNKFVLAGGGVLGLLIVVGIGALIGLRVAPKIQVVSDSAQLDKTTLNIDSKNHTVGIKTSTAPDGLQVGSTVSAAPQGSANIRMGLISGTDPSILFEDNQKNSWQVLAAGGSMQFIQGTDVRAKLDANALSLTNAINVGGTTNANGGLNVPADATLGKEGNNQLTIQGTRVNIPNNLNFANNTFVINSPSGTVSIGTASSSGFKFLVAGAVKVNGNLTLDGQVLAGTGSAKGPAFTFGNNNNTGIYEAGLNAVGVSAAGSQVLQVQQGSVFTVNGANIESDGYLRAGRGGSNPTFQILRFTGTLDGSGGANIGTGMSTGYARALNVQGYYRGNSNEAIPLNVDGITGSTIELSGGIPGRPYRVTFIYSQDNAGW